ncbi:MAG: hypothetical protein JWP35_3629 [Caulobacter sp.]|nr:hypothetical protein [Caulobacter sp.]
MSGVIWSKFYWSDWESDPSLRLCSLAAQGLWMRMLCVAAQHDPIGFVCIAGRPLDVTDLARVTGCSEAETDVLVSELGRNGVFSRDRIGRIYCRRMVKDAQAMALARINGAKGGNPALTAGASGGNPSRNPGPDKGRHKGGLKPQSPRASTRVEEPQGSSNPGGAAEAVRPPERRTASAPLVEGETGQRGLAALRAEVVGRHGEQYAKAWLDPADWCEAERAVVCRLGFAADRLKRDLRKTLKELGVSVRVAEAA